MTKKQTNRIIFLIISLITFAFAYLIRIINHNFGINMRILSEIEIYLKLISYIWLFGILLEYLIDNKVYKGFRYFCTFHKTKRILEKQMIDAGFYIKRSYYLDVPMIKIDLSNDLSKGILKIRNNLKFDKRFDDVVMSSALGKFVVERHYLTDDANYYIYELIDGSLSFKQTFNSFADFLQYSKSISDYKLFLDKRTSVKLQHTLLVGMTGSGKTYSLYSLLLQMIYKDIPYVLFLADPKGSSLAVIGQMVDDARTFIDVEEIISSFEEFVHLMRKRKSELKDKLSTKIDADYSDFGMTPYVFICDEYASFVSVLSGQEKKVRDKVKSLIYEIILQGRQLGFFLFLVMQKSDATLIDTALRDNIPLKIVLGNSEQQTYVTTFGAGVDIPMRHYTIGEGVFTEPVLASVPKLVQFPYLDFDILRYFGEAPRYVITGAPKCQRKYSV